MGVQPLDQALRWAVWLTAGGAAYLLPGWALLDGLLPEWTQMRAGEKLGLASGLSLALYPLLLLWTDRLGLHLGAAYAYAPALLAAAWLAWKPLRHGARLKWPRPRLTWAGGAALIAGLLILGTRLLAVRGLGVPLWGDSYQHSVITQLIVDHGGLFTSWAPYAEMTDFTYHFGFHSAAAVFHWLTGVPPYRAVLLAGQIINVLAVLALYPLALRAYPSAWSGAAALVVGGLLLWTPMIYTQWGRYTQLAGQAILPAAVCLAWTGLNRTDGGWKASIPAWLALSGLALTHYRVALFAGGFLVAYLLVCPERRTALKRSLWLGGGAALLALPWIGRVLGSSIWTLFRRQITTLPSQLDEFGQAYNAFGNLAGYLPGWVWPAAALALVVAVWRRQRGILLIAAWWALLLLATNPGWLGLPGSGVISNFAYWIAAYIPAAVIVAAGVGLAVEALSTGAQSKAQLSTLQMSAVQVAVLLALLVPALWGASRRLDDVNVRLHRLVTAADLRAAQWIAANTPPQARFLVNSFPAYGGAVVAGSDAGWWLPLLAGRQTTQPPLNYGNEREPWPGYRQAVNALPVKIKEKGITHPDVLRMLAERGIDYVYIGQLQGRVNNSEPLLDPETILSHRRFELVYHQEQVWIFKINP